MGKRKSNGPILEELTSIKNLLILELYGRNFPSDEIGKAIGKDASTIRGMFSKKNIAKGRKSKDE
jgi:hypothetical protein